MGGEVLGRWQGVNRGGDGEVPGSEPVMLGIDRMGYREHNASHGQRGANQGYTERGMSNAQREAVMVLQDAAGYLRDWGSERGSRVAGFVSLGV